MLTNTGSKSQAGRKDFVGGGLLISATTAIMRLPDDPQPQRPATVLNMPTTILSRYTFLYSLLQNFIIKLIKTFEYLSIKIMMEYVPTATLTYDNDCVIIKFPFLLFVLLQS